MKICRLKGSKEEKEILPVIMQSMKMFSRNATVLNATN